MTDRSPNPATWDIHTRTLVDFRRGLIVDVLVVARRPQVRWDIAVALGLPAAAACDPELAASRLAHPSAPRPDVVLLRVEDRADLQWLRRQTSRRDVGRVPVVAVVSSDDDRAAARAAGARSVATVGATPGDLGHVLRTALAPAVVIDLDGARTA